MPDPDVTARLHEDGRRFREEVAGLDVDAFASWVRDALGAAVPEQPRYTLAEVRVNLVTKTEIAARAGVGASAVHGWTIRHEDWPEPMHDGYRFAHYRRETGGVQAVYWWPQVQEFLTRHGFPRPYGGRRPRTIPGGTDGQ